MPTSPYAVEELHALVALEAHRAGTVVVGEDLGTVPDERPGPDGARPACSARWVFQFESSEDLPLPEPPASCLAALGTHDLPRFAAYLWAEDVTEREQRGVLTPDEASAEQAARRAWRRRLLRALGVSEDRDVAAITAAALEGCLTHLARSDAAIALVDLEDLWGEREQQNVPGTGPEAENWRRRGARHPRGAPRRRPPGRRPRRAGEGAGRMTTLRPGPRRMLSEEDLHWFNEGTHRRLGQKLGSHPEPGGGINFAVWAPNARRVSVVGDFNSWARARTPWRPGASRGSGRERFPRPSTGQVYKFAITTKQGAVLYKADPFARCTEVPPRTGSVIWDLSYEWGDGDWMASRGGAPGSTRPSRSTRSISEAGDGILRTPDGSSATTSWPTRSSSTSSVAGSPMSSSCP